MPHLMLLFVFRIKQSQFGHQLTAVADAEAHRIFTCVKTIDGLLGLLVIKDTGSPPLGGTEHVGVGESAAEDDEVHIFERFTPRSEVGQMHVFHVEAGQIERISHLALTVCTLVAQNSRTDTAPLTTVGR